MLVPSEKKSGGNVAHNLLSFEAVRTRRPNYTMLAICLSILLLLQFPVYKIKEHPDYISMGMGDLILK